jgi:hypothetical protein
MRVCRIAGSTACEYDGRYTCYACGVPGVCGACSAIRDYMCYSALGGWKKRKRRICDDCWEQERHQWLTPTPS